MSTDETMIVLITAGLALGFVGRWYWLRMRQDRYWQFVLDCRDAGRSSKTRPDHSEPMIDNP